MKKLYSCFIILTFFASCGDEENAQQYPAQENYIQLNQKGSSNPFPANSLNNYDNAGRFYDELFDHYYDGSTRSTATQNVIEDIEAISSTYDVFGSGYNYQTLSEERINYLAGRNNGHISSIIGASELSSFAKTSFGNFLIAFASLYEAEPDPVKICNVIINYEKDVLSFGALTENDHRIILTSTSILRYSSYRAKKKPKKNTDPYWNIWVTHVFGAEEGAEENMEKAVVLSLVTGIVSNK